jgi:uncharacterized membrane protein
MSKVLAGIWENLYGLLVEDGQLAVGIVVSLAIAWALTAYAAEAVRDAAGWVLLVLLIALTLANLYRAGRNARRRVAQKGA